MRREWLVLIAVSTVLLFGSGTTFPSMGIPLFAMMREFRWSEAAAGAAFLALGLVCAATSLAPMALIPRIGGRWTVVAGTALLAAGFFLASTTRTLATFYVAAAIFGFAFSLVANASGTYLIASWFKTRAPRMIGLYMMVGSLGGAVLPPVAGALVATGGGWRLYWVAMAAMAVLVAGVCALLIREPPTASGLEPAGKAAKVAHSAGWGYRVFLPTPQFMIIAAAMVATQACTITVAAVAVPHFTEHGWSAGYAAEILGLQGLVGTVATGISGWLTERFEPKLMLAFALLAEALGMMLLAFAHALWMTYAFVPIFGIGWSVTSLAVAVLLIRYFGSKGGTAALSTIWLLAGFSTAGPSIAGLVADATGSLVAPLALFGLLLLPIAFAALAMNAVRPVVPGGLEPRLQRE